MPALRDQVVELQMHVMALEARLAAVDVDNDEDGFSEIEGDCNDDDPTVFPGADEVEDNDVDDDCNGRVDDVEAAPPVPPAS